MERHQPRFSADPIARNQYLNPWGQFTMRTSSMRIVVYLGLAACPPGLAWSAAAGDPGATTAKVSITAHGQALSLQRDEQIALMFLTAISSLEDDCMRHAGRGCSMDELVNGGVQGADKWKINRLKFDPRTSDPNYTYTLNAGDTNWEAKATPKKPGLGGFYFVKAGFGFAKAFYSPKGEASIASTETDGYSIEGDIFVAH